MLASTCFLYLYPKNVPCQWQKLHIVLIIIIPALPSGNNHDSIDRFELYRHALYTTLKVYNITLNKTKQVAVKTATCFI